MAAEHPASRRSLRIGTRLQRFLMDVHILFYRRTGGRLGGKLAGRPMLLLTTIGRKSGKARITPIFYLPDGDRFLLIASNGGSSHHPQWWRNLQAHPQARVQIGRDTLSVIARQADAQERPALWARITTLYPNFAAYQRRTTREIPVVLLTVQQVGSVQPG
jgi:deazaflavin-dependent oxidoreductase (nitroreductase family)